MPRRLVIGAAVTVTVGLAISLLFPAAWLTRDQRALRALRAGEHERAADLFDDPFWRGVARFQIAAGLFDGVGTPEASFDAGNALVLLGRYDEAIERYDRALADRPDWPAARTNRTIAVSRRLERTGGEGTGGKLGADEIVFEPGGASSDGDEVDVAEGEPVEGAALEALWLRNVRTEPADFLRLKFASQLARRTAAGDDE